MKKISLLFILMMTIALNVNAQVLVPDQASDIFPSTGSFGNILSASDNDVQKALDTIDDAVRTHATDCTSLTDGKNGTICYEKDSDNLYVCEPSIGLCDTPGEWKIITYVEADTLDAVADRGAVTDQTITAGGFVGDLTGNADTATALAANGTNATAGNAILGVDASGNAEGAFDVLTQAELIDEDNMASDSAVRPPSQQSVKSYVDTQDAAQDECSEISGCIENAITASSSETLTNKTINSASNTITIVEADISDLVHTVDTTLSQEEVEDYTGALIGDGTGTRTGISFTYQDATGDIDVVVDHDAATNYVANEHIDWTNASAGTIHATNYVDNNTTYTAGTNITLTSTTFDVDDAFIINNGDDTTTGKITAQGGFDAGDGNITNVGDVALDSISSDSGTTINVTLGTDAGDDFNVGSNKLVVKGNSGNIGIGNSAPTEKVDVTGTVKTSNGLTLTGGRLTFNSGANYELKNDSVNRDMLFTLTGGSGKFVFSGNNVGIGTTGPSGKLDVEGGDVFIGTGTLTNTSGSEDLSVTGNLEVDGTIYGDGSGLTGIATGSSAYNDITTPDNNSTIAFGGFTNSWTTNETASDFFNITNSGNFGDVSLMVLQATGNPTNGTILEIINTDADVDSLVVSGTDLVVAGNGNVGIGTLTPLDRIHIFDTADAEINIQRSDSNDGSTSAIKFKVSTNTVDDFYKGGIFFERTGTAGIGSLHLKTDASTLSGNVDKTDGGISITSAGNVGIGTSAPSGLLDVVSSSTSRLKVNSSGELQGDPLADQMSYMLAGDILDDLTDPRLILTWLTPSDNGTEIDQSGKAHNCTYVNASDFTTSDQLHKGLVWSLDFDGTNDYLTCGDSDDFSFGDGSNDSAFSVGGWVEIVDDSTTKEIFAKFDQTSGVEKREWDLFVSTTENLTLRIYDESADVSCTRALDSSLTAGWYFVVATYDGTGGASAMDGATLYINGVVTASTASNNASYVAMENLTGALQIGAQLNVGGVKENEWISDMGAIYLEGRELSAADVWKMYVKQRGYYHL